MTELRTLQGSTKAHRTKSLGEAISSGLKFLSSSQYESGGFRSYMTVEDPPAVFHDYSPFPAAMMAHCLGFLDTAESKAMISKTICFLLSQMDRRGLWTYFASEHPYETEWSGKYHFSPFDLDDTSCAYGVLRDNGVSFPDSRKLLMANRDERGLFYTWLVPRKELFFNPHSISFALEQLKSQARFKQFFELYPATLEDVDAVVNANVLYILEKGKETAPVISFLEQTIKNEKEESLDKWHHSRFNLYYFMSKSAYAGKVSFKAVEADILHRIHQASHANGMIGINELETALAINTIFNFKQHSMLLARAAEWLLSCQQENGSWRNLPLYYGGPTSFSRFGSEEISTAFCLEALARYAHSTQP